MRNEWMQKIMNVVVWFFRENLSKLKSNIEKQERGSKKKDCKEKNDRLE